VAPAFENKLIQIVDGALAEASYKGGAWVACRPGCCQCCIGVFPISQSDALRLREGMQELALTDPDRAANIACRALNTDLSSFPGDISTGILGEDLESQTRFESFADDVPCPALDPQTGKCDLYAWRPMTCRTFGPALRLNSDSVDICELCYEGATDAEIVACEVELATEELETALELEAEASTGLKGQTIVAFALR
jgi:Fe-S-cluster containining protein